MKKIITTVFITLMMYISTIICHAYDYSGQEYAGNLSKEEYVPICDETDADVKYRTFCLEYEKNKQAGDFLANLRLVDKHLPDFYGTAYEMSLYDVRTESVCLMRQKEKSPLVLSGYRFDVRKNTGYVVAGLTNLDYKNISALRVSFAVVDKNGVPTGKMKDFYYSTGEDISPGETEAFIWQVDGMTEPAWIGDFRGLELVFKDRSKWYAHMEN